MSPRRRHVRLSPPAECPPGTGMEGGCVYYCGLFGGVIRLGPLRSWANLASEEERERRFLRVTRDHDRTRRASEDYPQPIRSRPRKSGASRQPYGRSKPSERLCNILEVRPAAVNKINTGERAHRRSTTARRQRRQLAGAGARRRVSVNS